MWLHKKLTLQKTVFCGLFLSCLLVHCECDSGTASASTAGRRLPGADPHPSNQEPPEAVQLDSGQIIKEQDAEEGMENRPDDRYMRIDVQTLGGKNLAAGPVYAAQDQTKFRELHTEEERGVEETEIPEGQCAKPELTKNLHVHGTDYSIGSQLYLYCDHGYHLVGPDHISCLPVPDPFHHVGIWEPQTMPQCHPDHEEEEEEAEEEEMSEVDAVRCPTPEAPVNGYVRGTEHYIGAQVDFDCDPGYSLVGPERVTCLAVPDPFHHLAIWDPPTKPRCLNMEAPQSTLPLVLVPHPSMSRASDNLGHRRTVSDPNVGEIEGLPAVCSLPMVKGPCKATFPRFYFDRKLRECTSFTYGGCDGNSNNFETFEDCQKTCA